MGQHLSQAGSERNRDRAEPYSRFLIRKTQHKGQDGFTPTDLPSFLFDFQAALVEFSLRRARSAIFADCGLGKTPIQLAWAAAVADHAGKPVLIATPLAVSYQLMREAEKFSIAGCVRSQDGTVPDGARIVATNYERLERFDARQFSGMVCDESSILKNFNGLRRGIITSMMRKMPYRLLCTATAAPNDYIELGTSSEALGELGYMDMLTRYFKNEQNVLSPNRLWQQGGKWRFKGHAELPFWRWVCSWARALRKPSDIGFDDSAFELPPLTEREHHVPVSTLRPGMLFELPVIGLREEREERRRSLRDRCEAAAELANTKDQVIAWCNLNDEGRLLTRLIDGAEEVSGSDTDEDKEAKLVGFAQGNIRALVTKPKIGAWGLNFQNCAHVIYFPSHSYEQYYQAVRRCWRFGQHLPVKVDIVTTKGQAAILSNFRRKAKQAAKMFDALVDQMNDATSVNARSIFSLATEVPPWL